jgi:hypothetical protein
MQRREITGVFDPTYRGILGARKEASDRSDPSSLKCRNGRERLRVARSIVLGRYGHGL